jgi:hypothetical protein
LVRMRLDSTLELSNDLSAESTKSKQKEAVNAKDCGRRVRKKKADEIKESVLIHNF